MLNASPTFLSRATPQVTDGYRQLSINPQYDPFESANKKEFSGNTRPIAVPQMTEDRQDKIDYVKSRERFVCQSSENQVLPRALHGLNWTECSTETTIPLADLDSLISGMTNTAWLEDSLNELAACPAEAIDEGLEEPSESGLAKAKRLLQEVSNHVTGRPDIYPIDEGAIAIDFRSDETGAGVLFLIEHDGSGALFHRTRNSKGRLRVDDAADLLREGGLRELDRVGIR